MPESILVVAAHPDDEVLGCGGTIARFANEGARINIAFLADGVTSRGGEASSLRDALRVRRAAAARACELLSATPVYFGDFPDNRLDTVALLDLVTVIEGLVSKYCPDTVFTHHAGDLNVDHRRVYEATVTACRPQPGNCVRTLLSFEVPSSTEWQLAEGNVAFVPNWFIDISGSLSRKLAALDAYAAELRAWPHPRSQESVTHLARWRGSSVGFDAAEAFVLGRRRS